MIDKFFEKVKDNYEKSEMVDEMNKVVESFYIIYFNYFVFMYLFM